MKKIILFLLLSANYVFASSGSYLMWENYFFTLNNNIITIPEYIATYMIAVGGYFFTIIIMFELIMTAYKYVAAGFNFQQIRPVILNMISTIGIVIALLYTPGLKTANSSDGEIKTKLLVDIVSAFLASGSRIADVFSYELLFGNGYFGKHVGLKIFEPTLEGPKKDTPLNGFILNTFSSSLYNSSSTVKQNLTKFNENVDKFLENAKILTDPSLLTAYKENYEGINKSIKDFENAYYTNTNVNSDDTENYSNNFRMKDGEIEITVPFTNNATPEEVVKITNSLNEKVQTVLSEEIKDTLIEPTYQFYEMLEKDLETAFDNDHTLKNKTVELDRFKSILRQQKDKFNSIPLISSVNGGGDSPENFKTLFQDSFTIANGTEGNAKVNQKYIGAAMAVNQMETLKLLESAIASVKKNNGLKKVADDFLVANFSKRISDSYINKKDGLKKLYEDVETLSKYRKDIEGRTSEITAAMESAKTTQSSTTAKTLNELYQKSNFLNNLTIFTFIFDDFEVESMVKDMNLADDYEFHWYDLGKYYLGIKTLMSENFLKQMAGNNVTVALENDVDMKAFIDCTTSQTPCKNNSTFDVKQTMTNLSNTLSKGATGAFIVGGVAIAGASLTDGGRTKMKNVTKGFFNIKNLTGIFLKNDSVFISKILFPLLKTIFLFFLVVVFLYSVIPLVFWYVALINWFFKSSILLVSFCFTFVFLALDNKKNQIINNIFVLIGQAITPIFLVGFFFLVVNMSNILDSTIYNAIPLGDLLNNINGSSSIKGGEDDGVITKAIMFLLNMVLNGFILVILIALNFNLYRFLFDVDQFVSEAIGSNISNTLIKPENVIKNFTMGTEKLM